MARVALALQEETGGLEGSGDSQVRGADTLIAVEGSCVRSIWGEVPDGSQSGEQGMAVLSLVPRGMMRPQDPCPSLWEPPHPGYAETCILLRLFLHFPASGWCASLNSSFVVEHHTAPHGAGSGHASWQGR